MWAALALIAGLLIFGALIGYYGFGRHTFHTDRTGDLLQHWAVPLAFVVTALAAWLSARTSSAQAVVLERSFQAQGGPLLKLDLGQEITNGAPTSPVHITSQVFTQHCGLNANHHRVCWVDAKNAQSNASGVAFDLWIGCVAEVPRRGTSGERDTTEFWVGPFTLGAGETARYHLFDVGDAQDFVVEIDSVEYVDLYGVPINRAYGDCRLVLTNTGEVQRTHKVLAPGARRRT